MPMKIGNVMLDILCFLEQEGPKHYMQVRDAVKPEWEPGWVNRYLLRAVDLGLVRFSGNRPRAYFVVDDWRESKYVKREAPKRPTKIVVPEKRRMETKAVNSVFALGAL